MNSAARDIVRKCESGELTGPKCEGRFHHMARSLDRTEGRVMEGKYSMQFRKFEALARTENGQDPSTKISYSCMVKQVFTEKV